METVLVVGAGFMGSGIAQICAQAGFRVNLMDVKPDSLDKAMKTISQSVGKLSEKGLVSESSEVIVDRISGVWDFSSASKAHWVIESAPEVEGLKKELFHELDERTPTSTPLATNTSSIPITRIAKSLKHPERVLGLHFFGPVPLMGLVEVVKGERTSSEVFDRGARFVKSLGKTPVRVHKDIPCFVMNRVFSAAFREAVDLVAQGIVSPEDLDAGMKLGYAWNAGPFEIADNAGLDTILLIGKFMEAVGETDLFPKSDLIDRMVQEGRIGRKSGEGFYQYNSDGKRIPRSERSDI